MKCYTYVVERDFGFAPNPFGGYCTLATCKPKIRSAAQVGDWILGTGSSKKKLSGKLVFMMEVTEKLTFNQYWKDSRFQYKKPVLNGSLMQAYGDNIYQFDAVQQLWLQADSHHSYEDGSTNFDNLKRDTQSDKVLISNHFYYFGKACPILPPALNEKVCHHIGHKPIVEETVINQFLHWVKGQFEPNQLIDFPNHFESNQFKRYNGKS